MPQNDPDFIPAQADSGPDFIPAQKASTPPPAPPQPSTWQKLTASGASPETEAFAQKHPVLGPPARALDAAGGAMFSLPGAMAQTAMHPIEAGKGIIDSLKAWGDPNTWKGAPSVLPEAIGQGIGNAAGGELVGAATRGAGSVLPKVGDFAGENLREAQTGKLKPWVQNTSRAGGALAGRALGSELAGYLFGPKLADSIIPKHPNPEGWSVKLPGRIPDVGKADPLSLAVEQGIANRIPTRIPKVDPELGSPENPGWTVPLSGKIPRSQIPFITPSGVTELPGVNVVPEPRGEFDQEIPNYMASVKRSKLLDLARSGKPGAGTQLQRLGRPVIYTPKGSELSVPSMEDLQKIQQEHGRIPKLRIAADD